MIFRMDGCSWFILEQHVCIWAKLLKFRKKKTWYDASDVSAYADDEEQWNDS